MSGIEMASALCVLHWVWVRLCILRTLIVFAVRNYLPTAPDGIWRGWADVSEGTP